MSRRIVLLGLAAALLVGGITLLAAARWWRGEDGGASGPQAAVEELLDRLSSDHPTRALGRLAPDEVDALGPALSQLTQLTDEAGLTVDGAFPEGASIRRDLDDPVVRQLGDNLARVKIRGSITVDVDTDALPDTARRLLRSSEDDDIGWTGRGDQPEELVVYAVRVDGGWYVSPTMTGLSILGAFEELPASDPDAAASLPPTVGADSARAAVTNSLNAALRGDIGELIGSLDPASRRRVAPFADALSELWRRKITDGGRVTVDTLSLEPTTSPNAGAPSAGDAQQFVLSGATATIDEAAGIRRVVFDGRCWVTSDAEAVDAREPTCLDDVVPLGSPRLVAISDGEGRWVTDPIASITETLEAAVDSWSVEDLYWAFDAPELVAPVATVEADTVEEITIPAATSVVVRIDIPSDGQPHAVSTDAGRAAFKLPDTGERLVDTSGDQLAPDAAGLYLFGRDDAGEYSFVFDGAPDVDRTVVLTSATIPSLQVQVGESTPIHTEAGHAVELVVTLDADVGYTFSTGTEGDGYFALRRSDEGIRSRLTDASRLVTTAGDYAVYVTGCAGETANGCEATEPTSMSLTVGRAPEGLTTLDTTDATQRLDLRTVPTGTGVVLQVAGRPVTVTATGEGMVTIACPLSETSTEASASGAGAKLRVQSELVEVCRIDVASTTVPAGEPVPVILEIGPD